MKRFLIFALLGPLVLCLVGLVFRFLTGWGGGMTSGHALVFALPMSYVLGLPPLLAAWYVDRRGLLKPWSSRWRATALTGLLVGILYPFVVASLETGRLYSSDRGLFLVFGLLIGAIAAACSFLAYRMDEKQLAPPGED